MTRICRTLLSKPAEIFSAFADDPYALWLDSADLTHPNSRTCYIMAAPAEIIESRNGIVTITRAGKQKTVEGCPFEILKERLQAYDFTPDSDPDLPLFQGGAAGLFGYDLGRMTEKLPNRILNTSSVPDMAVGIYTQVYAYDKTCGQGHLITHGENEKKAQARQEWFLQKIGQKRHPVGPYVADLSWKSNFSPDQYRAAVRKVVDYIHAGDIFQTNLSQRFETRLPKNFDSYAHYLHLRRSNPAPFSGYFNLGRVKLSCSSPEQFLICENGMVTTKPIKGTRPRMRNKVMDRAIQKDLLESAKDRAENIMIVDLLRNDLSKVCTAPSVKVEKLCALESFETVHHLVSTISGRLKKNKTALDLLKVCFPGGSITGAPKIRAMEIIEELETHRRGPYTGALGFIGFDGSMETNLLIRTLVYEDDKVCLSVGGGIVADSDPALEYQETLHKAKGMFVSFKDKSGKSVAV